MLFLVSINNAITSAIHNWLLPSHPHPHVPSSVDIITCQEDQTNMGWNLAARGLFHREWSTLQEVDDHSNKLGQWQAKLSAWIIQQAHSIWCERNNEIHQPEDTTSRQEKETHAQITKLKYGQHRSTPLSGMQSTATNIMPASKTFGTSFHPPPGPLL
jgi:hypothetical protein